MDFAIYLSEKILFFATLFCMIISFRLGRVSMSIMIVCVILTMKELIDGYLLNFGQSMNFDDRALLAFWYVAFTLTNLAAGLAVYVAHVTMPVTFSLAARVYLWKVSFVALVLICRCLERIYLDTQHFQFAYTKVLPALSYLMLFFLGVSLFVAYRKSKDFGERIEWNI